MVLNAIYLYLPAKSSYSIGFQCTQHKTIVSSSVVNALQQPQLGAERLLETNTKKVMGTAMSQNPAKMQIRVFDGTHMDCTHQSMTYELVQGMIDTGCHGFYTRIETAKALRK